MTAAEIDAYVTEVERRFRERTPASDIDMVLAETRVGRGEMRQWFLATTGRDLDVDDDVLALDAPLKALFKRLRKEFPHEVW